MLLESRSHRCGQLLENGQRLLDLDNTNQSEFIPLYREKLRPNHLVKNEKELQRLLEVF